MDIDLGWDVASKDAYLNDVMKNEIGTLVENPFNFNNWRSALIEPRQSTLSTYDHEIVQYKLGLTHDEQLSSLPKTDHCSTNFSLGSTRNAPKKLNESPMLETCTDDVYAISEDNGSDKEVDKPKKTVPQNLTPVTIMVVDTISSVRSGRLLRVLLDLGSTTTLINKKCLPRHCKPCKISSSRKWIP